MGILYEKSPVARFTISVASTGSKEDDSGWCTPDNASDTVGKNNAFKRLTIKAIAITFLSCLYLLDIFVFYIFNEGIFAKSFLLKSNFILVDV